MNHFYLVMTFYLLVFDFHMNFRMIFRLRNLSCCFLFLKMLNNIDDGFAV